MPSREHSRKVPLLPPQHPFSVATRCLPCIPLQKRTENESQRGKGQPRTGSSREQGEALVWPHYPCDSGSLPGFDSWLHHLPTV